MSAQIHYRLAAIEDKLKEIDEGRAEYRLIHKIAKVIVCSMIAYALYLDGASLICILTIPSWFFLVNTVAYVIEHIRGTIHRHEVI